MKKLILLLSLLCMSSWALADENLAPLLNRVALQLRAWQWITTKTAVVSVNVNAAINDRAVETLQHNVLQKLSTLADKAEWHMVSFNRQQDKSGLENLQMMAQARLPQADLSGIREKAKNLSKPGETYSIDNIAFTPSEDEMRETMTALRANIYQQIKAETEALNKAYPEQKYYLHQVDFMIAQGPMPVAQNNMFLAKMANARVAPPQMSVGNKQELVANVVLTAMPEPVVQKLTATH